MKEQINFQVPIPGGVFALITFPGVMTHELSHYFMCKIFGVKVHELKLFHLNEEHFSFSNSAPVGWVRHSPPKEYYKTFLISIAPIIFNTLLALLLYSLAIPFFKSESLFLVSLVFIYLGFCCGVNAFPSSGDADILWREANQELTNHNYQVLFAYPVIVIIYIAHYLSMVWLDWIYGGALFFLVASWFGVLV